MLSCLLDHCKTQRWCRCYYPKSCLLPQMGMAFHSVDPWYYEVEIIDTRPKIWCVLPVIDDDIYSLCRVSSVTVHQYCCMGENSLSLSIIFPVQVWQWRILTIKMETQCVKSNIINFYIFVIQIILTKEIWSLCYLVIFFGFHLHYLHLNVIWFPMVLIARKAFLLFLFLRCHKLFCCRFITMRFHLNT